MAVALLNSLRKRFVLAATLLLLLSIAIFSYINLHLLREYDTPTHVHRNQEAFHTLELIRDNLRRLESSTYQHAVLLDDTTRSQIEKHLGSLSKLHTQETETMFVRLGGTLLESYQKLHRLDGDIQQEVKALIFILSKPDRRFPTAPILREELSPLNERFTQELQLAISDTQTARENPLSVNYDVDSKLLSLRYYWMQQISTVRSFIANRIGIVNSPEISMRRNLNDRALYSALIDENLDWLQRVDASNALTIQQSLSLAQMLDLKKAYDNAFEKVREIYLSDNWRKDYPILRERIQPLFSQAWNTLDAMESEFQSLNSRQQLSLYGATNQLQDFIWMFNIAALLVVLIAYFSFEYLLRRPIKQMALAMKAHASGADFVPEIRSNLQENQELVLAFEHMKKEVDARQRKLESILDNAAEGIITFDSEGMIINFNKAAEELFRTNASNAIKRGINEFIPDLFVEQRSFVFFERETGLSGDELVMEIPRRNSIPFIASIKLSRTSLDERYYYTVLISDITEQVEMLNNLKRVAERDSLTALYNRKYLLDYLDELIESRTGHSDALLYLDLDNFKFANDTLGHLAGDQIIIEVTSLLQQRLRDQDLLARLGGDEFAIILHDVNEQDAMEAANDYRKTISDYHYVHTGKTIDIGCSIGIALKSPDIIRTEELLAKADYACHVAKTRGRNQVHLYHLDDKREVAAIYADMGWTRIIKRAIENDRFFLVTQPIVDSRSQKVMAREVLLRLNDQNSTIAMPNGFIPAAERFGLMPDIDRWVIGRTIGYIQEDIIQGVDSVYSINLSAATFNDTSTLEYIRYLIEHSRIKPHSLIFEITETMAITHLNKAIEFLEGLRSLGCRTALDDFGSGHASYLYLKDLPVDYVKIDGSFVRDLLKEPLHLAMVRSMKEVADAVGIQTIAEYVEDIETKEMLASLGVDYIQGYYCGRPEPWKSSASNSG
ncbi:MAG: EAL domain-containing protein [Gammaproteobacteria bacterium]|nr:EAL domain-containing protein [Gammaproteobacteria bacterium]